MIMGIPGFQTGRRAVGDRVCSHPYGTIFLHDDRRTLLLESYFYLKKFDRRLQIRNRFDSSNAASNPLRPTQTPFTVEDIERALGRVGAEGGKILSPKTAIGEYGFIAHVEDCEGNRVALHSPL